MFKDAKARLIIAEQQTLLMEHIALIKKLAVFLNDEIQLRSKLTTKVALLEVEIEKLKEKTTWVN